MCVTARVIPRSFVVSWVREFALMNNVNSEAVEAPTRPRERRTGVERFQYIKDRRRRLHSYHQQTKQILADMNRLLLTTGAPSDFRSIPETGNIILHTAGIAPYGLSMMAYVNIIEFMQSNEGSQVPFDPVGAYLDFTGQSGAMAMRALCDALRRFGVEEQVVSRMDDQFQSFLVARGLPYSK